MEEVKNIDVSSSVHILIGMRKYKAYTDEEFIKIARNVKTLAGLLKGLSLRPAGGNYAHAKKTIQRLNVDCSHWTGQGWSKNQQLKNWKDYSRVSGLKKHLIKKRGHQCEDCKLNLWKEKLIGLEVHHINGDRTNNEETNLQLLCGNCHHATPNFRNRNSKNMGVENKKIKIHKEKPVKNKIITNPNWRSEPKLYCRKVIRPSNEELVNLVEQFSIEKLGKKFGVSGNAVRKWCKSGGIPTKPAGYWSSNQNNFCIANPMDDSPDDEVGSLERR